MNLSEPELQEKLKNFQCRRCNQCCRQPGFVYISEPEAERIAAYLKMDIRDFMNHYCDFFDRRKLVLKKFPDESCVFLTEAGCSVYEARPGQCREFPFTWRTPRSFEYCEGLKTLFTKP
jgi:Fe-S-cluster containining protein